MIEGGDAIAGDKEELIAGERVDIADLAPGSEGKSAEVGLEKGSLHHVEGTTSLGAIRLSLMKLEKLVFYSGWLVWPVRATSDDGSRGWAKHGKSSRSVALLRVERLALDPAAEKRRERRAIQDVEVSTRVSGSVITPLRDLVVEVMPHRHSWNDAGLEDHSEGEQDTRCK